MVRMVIQESIRKLKRGQIQIKRVLRTMRKRERERRDEEDPLAEELQRDLHSDCYVMVEGTGKE